MQNANALSETPTPSLEEIVHGLQDQLEAQSVLVKAQDARHRDQIEALSSRFGRERLRWRVQAGVAAAIAAGTLLLSPGARQAVAQAPGINLTALYNQVQTIQKNLNDEISRAKSAEATLQSNIDNIALTPGPKGDKGDPGDSGPFVLSEDGTTYVLSGYNLQIVSGSGATNGNPLSPFGGLGTVNGLGNLIIGYNENLGNYVQTGSHNLVVGPGHRYSSYGGFVAGFRNQITGPYSSVSGGRFNTASVFFSSVSGGSGSTASGLDSSVSGGSDNTASGYASWVSGGYGNTASEDGASVSGGQENTAYGFKSSILGGRGISLSTPYGTYPAGP